MPSTEPSCCPSSPQLACRPPPAARHRPAAAALRRSHRRGWTCAARSAGAGQGGRRSTGHRWPAERRLASVLPHQRAAVHFEAEAHGV